MIRATIVMKTISTNTRWDHSQKTRGLIGGTSRPKASGQSGIDLLAPVSRTILPRTMTKNVPTAAMVESSLTDRMDCHYRQRREPVQAFSAPPLRWIVKAADQS